mmetsp:Transcript_10641/g.30250  ORF Transcript_10641/g.30250 Transcript_10641/m.30250 type:complete len:101 (+) Transcript_10641:675-977(+)
MNGFLRIRRIIFAHPEKNAYLTKAHYPLNNRCFGLHAHHHIMDRERFVYLRLPILTYAELWSSNSASLATPGLPLQLRSKIDEKSANCNSFCGIATMSVT